MEDFEHLPKMAGWHESKLLVPTSKFKIADLKPNHNITFTNQEGIQVGTLDFNGPYMTFEGNSEESARTFFNFVASCFDQRLKDEYTRGYNDAKNGKEAQR
jgi:hypothetical protein